jgi:uncharacterized protein
LHKNKAIKKMKTPFEFGRVVTGDTFINRKAELTKLSANFLNNINTIIISPRRWGKSSLVKNTSISMEKTYPEIRFVFIDLFNIRTEEQFYKLFTRQVIKAGSSKLEEWIEDAKTFITRLSPRISFGVDPVTDFEISFDLKSIQDESDEILNLPEKLAEKKNCKFIVCIDEFQNIGSFNESLAFQKKLRSVWQYHKQVTYCFYGSKRHMIAELFEKRSYPFYKFGDLINLQKIEKIHFTDFIIRSFSNTARSISQEMAEKLVDIVKGQPYYVQQLAHITWENTETAADDKIIDLALEELINTNSIFYESETENLSNMQINLLKAIASGVSQLTSAQVLLDYNLGTSGNVIKNQRILEKREFLNKKATGYEFEDPVFEIWFRKIFM